jgi:hypothetical protein
MKESEKDDVSSSNSKYAPWTDKEASIPLLFSPLLFSSLLS